MTWRKWIVRSLVLIIASAIAAGVILYLSWTNPTAVREQVLGRLHTYLPGAAVSLESARLKLFGGISVNELHLARRGGRGDSEFAYIPHGTIDPDKEMLSQGRMAIRRVHCHKAQLHVVRDSDGSWNVAGVLADPDPRRQIPMMIFDRAVLVVEDRTNPPRFPTLQIRDVDLTIINDPVSTIVFEGTGLADVAARVQLRGSWGRMSHEFTLSIEALDFSITDKLIERAGQCYPQIAEHARQLGGIAKIQASVEFRPRAPQPWTHDIRLQLTNGKLSHPQIPIPLESLDARCRCTNGIVRIERLVARSGETHLEATGRAMSFSSDADLEGSLKIEHLSVASNVFTNLPEKLQVIQRDYNPEGFADIGLDFQRRGGRWRTSCVIYPCGGSMLCAKFPYQLERIAGKIEHRLDQSDPEHETSYLNLELVGYTAAGYTGAQEVRIEGTVQGKKPAGVDVRIWAKNVAIDEKLCAALTRPDLQKLVRSFSPAGQADIEAHIHRLQGETTFGNRYFIHFHDALMTYDVFPYPVENVSGTLDIRPDYWEFRDFRGSHKDATFHCQGRSIRRGSGSDLLVAITGTNLLLDSELQGSLHNESLKRTWVNLSPTGRIDFEARIHRAAEETQPDITVVASPLRCGMTASFFPYALSDVTGIVQYHRQEVLLSNMQARHGPTRVRLGRAKVCLKPEGGVTVDMPDLSGDPSVKDPDFVHALPAALQKAIGLIHSDQPLVIRTRITVDVPPDTGVSQGGVVTPVGNSERGAKVGAPARPASYIYWDGEVDLNDAVLHTGIQMQHVSGRLACRGSYQGGVQALAGNFYLDQAVVFGQPFRDIQSQMVVDHDHPDFVDFRTLKARLFDGEVGGSARVKCGDGIEYDINLTASQVKLEELGGHNQLGPKARLSGLAGARIYLHGKGSEINGLQGGGTIDVPNGKMYNLPLLLDLIKVLSLRAPDETAFEEAHVRFEIHGRQAEFKRIDLYGNAVSLSGLGTMCVDGSDLKLDFFAVWGRALQWMPPVIDQIPAKFAQCLLTIKMRGKIGDVQCTKEPVPILLEPMKEFLERMRKYSALVR
jgi:hypothetical protein